ncbi:hypothetical protein WJ969_13745 [Achromobacter xylosoxidans]
MVKFSNADFPLWEGPVELELGVTDTLNGQALSIGGKAQITNFLGKTSIEKISLNDTSGLQLISQSHILLDRMLSAAKACAGQST